MAIDFIKEGSRKHAPGALPKVELANQIDVVSSAHIGIDGTQFSGVPVMNGN